MIDRSKLLSDLQKVLTKLEADLLERSESSDVPDVGATLRAEFERAKKAERTAQNYEDWRSDAITQASAAWVLACVFVRFLEDNRLIDPPKIAGPGERLQRARDEHELYFREHPTLTDRDYLLSLFDDLAQLPGTRDLFGEHNPIRELPNWLSGDAAGELLKFFQKIEANSGLLVHDFADSNWDTRFLGDLYQDLSEAARKKYALLQTPEFVEEFILERTLEPALDEFTLDAPPVEDRLGNVISQRGFRMIDPACGSGHFLLGSFRRILDRWQRREPGTNVRVLVQRTLDSVHGVDVNPFAVAIARFRLMLAAMRACGIARLDTGVPGFKINLACGDSLIHGPGSAVQTTLGDWTPIHHAYQPEDLKALQRILQTGYYHAVVANPPYITPKDRALNEKYRKLYPDVCHMKYSLAVPFMARLFRLAVREQKPRGTASSQTSAGQVAEVGHSQLAGFVGQITANSFMKREFGKKLIESFFPNIDLTHVLDTSGAYIPGHGTPTVILFGRHRSPVSSTLRTVMGIRGEPSTPDDPARGLVWLAIIAQLDQPGSQNEFVSVGDSERVLFHKHPWSIGGGGAAELKEQLEQSQSVVLSDVAASSGVMCVTGEDDAYVAEGAGYWRRNGVVPTDLREFGVGEDVRDWQLSARQVVLFPYDDKQAVKCSAESDRLLWPSRSTVAAGIYFGQRKTERGMDWREYAIVIKDRLRIPMSIVLGEVATHNHFVLDRGGKVFNRTAPVIKLPRDASEDDHLALLGLLNSSTACFWMKQVCFPKGTTTGDISKEKGKAESNRFAFSATALGALPLPNWSDITRRRVVELSRSIKTRADLVTNLSSVNRLEFHICDASASSIPKALEQDRAMIARLKGEMIFLQEELDWTIYAAYGLAECVLPGALSDDVPSITAIERAFCGLDMPANLPPALLELWKSRRRVINEIEAIRLIETPVYKRPWAGRQGVYGSGARTTAERQHDVQHSWLLNRLESYFDFDGRMNDARRPTAKLDIALVSVAKLADVARQDAEFQQVGELFRDDPAFDVQALVTELVAAECVPLLPVLRYKPSGLIKRGVWERTWDLQRQEDAIDARTNLPSTDPQHLSEDAARDLKQKQVGDIPVPTKYDSKDFLDSNLWRLRGKLDVPKERWINFPHCEGSDGTPVIAWAGYDHLQQAKAISAYYVDIQERLGGRDDPRLIPLLAGMLELLPWLKQWHNDPDATFDGMRMGDYFDTFVTEEARQLGKTVPEIKAWEPPQRTRNRGRR